MSDRMKIPAHEVRTVRVFAVDDPPDRHLPEQAVHDALDAQHLNVDEIELFDVSDLQGLGLSAYLHEGHGIPEVQLADMRARLDALTGRVLLLPSRAFGGRAQIIAPRHPLRLVGTFTEPGAQVSFAPLPDRSARGNPALSGGSLKRHRRAAAWLVLGLGGLMLLTLALVIGLAGAQ